MRVVITTILFLIAGLVTAFAGGDHIVTRSVFEDKSGAFSIDEVVLQPFQPAEPILSAGFTSAASWLKLTIRPRADGGPLVLLMRPTFLDEITLYEQDSLVPGGWKSRVTGDRIPFVEREWPAASLGFLVNPSAPETTYYLRLKTTSSSLLRVEALGLQEARAHDFRVDLLMVFYAALMLWILFWAATEFVLSREALLGCFVLVQIIYFPYATAIMGYLAPLFPTAPAGLLDLVTNYLVFAVVLVTLVFYRVLLTRFSPAAFAMRALDILILMSASTIILLTFGILPTALRLNAGVLVMIAPVLLVTAFTARQDAFPGRMSLRLVCGLQAVSLLITVLPLIGIVQATSWNLYAVLIHGLISALLIFGFLYVRSQQIMRLGAMATTNLQLAEQQLAIEIEHRDLQNRFMAMLTHELKTPLSVARVSLDAMKVEGEFPRRITRALNSINDIVDRLMQADRIDQGALPSTWGPCDVGAMIEEVVLTHREDRNVRIEVGPLPPLNCDGQLLAMAIGNLIDNALKYSAPDSVVDICAVSESRAGRPGISIAIENIPNAAGLPDQNRVFSKFYRSSGAQSKSGSGLGLYVVRGIVRSMNGEADYRPVSGKARFVVWLPC